MHIRDALFNWLQMKIVAEARPHDRAATETFDFFALILREDHHIHQIEVQFENSETYLIRYTQEQKEEILRVDRESVEKLLTDIEENPIYNQNFPDG